MRKRQGDAEHIGDHQGGVAYVVYDAAARKAAFKQATKKVAEAPPKAQAIPGIREQVTLRFDPFVSG